MDSNTLNRFLKVKLQVRTVMILTNLRLMTKSVFIIYFYRYLTNLALNKSHIYRNKSE